MTHICFRFDIDTPTCIQHGVPALLHLARSVGTPFTFFFNPGRAVWHRAGLSHRAQPAPKPALTPRRKLGLTGFVQTALFNPHLSRLSAAEQLAGAESEGHEIGLHGGRNHAHWQHDAHRWSDSEIRDQVRWGLAAVNRLGLTGISSFASPGWNSPQTLPEILASEGIYTLADRYGSDKHELIDSDGSGFALITTTLTGEPGGVGYLEASFARGWSTKTTIEHFMSELDNAGEKDVVAYDHPCFAGREGLPRLISLIQACRSEAVGFTTVGRIGQRLLERE